jgi:hypothetical protein
MSLILTGGTLLVGITMPAMAGDDHERYGMKFQNFLEHHSNHLRNKRPLQQSADDLIYRARPGSFAAED